MRRFAIVAILTVALNLLFAMLPVVVRAVSANLYVLWALSLVCALALYAAVLIVMRIRRTREMDGAPEYREKAERLLRWVRGMLARNEWLAIRFLERDLAVLSREFYVDMAQAKDKDARGEIHSRYAHERDYTSENLEDIYTERLLRQARALDVPLPSPRPHGFDQQSGDENWWLGSVMGGWCLTPEGRRRLRQTIRAERKDSRENASFWFGIAIGLIGALTGLVAVLQK